MARRPRVGWALAWLAPLLSLGCGSEDADDPPAGTVSDAGNGENGGEPPSSDWTAFGNGLHNPRTNLAETTLSVDNVSQLKKVWTIEDRAGMIVGVPGTPLVVDGIVYWVSWTGIFHAATLDGEEVWTHRHGGTFVSTGVYADGELYYSGTVGIRVLDASSGAIRREGKFHENTAVIQFGSPIIVDDLILFGVASMEVFTRPDPKDFRGTVVGVDRHTLEQRWVFDVTHFDGVQYETGNSVWSSPAVDRERKMLFIGVGQAYDTPATPLSSSLLALNYETGEYVWHHAYAENDVWHISRPAGRDHDVGSTPNLFKVGEVDAVGVGGKDGNYKAFDRDDGTVLWEVNLGPSSALGGVMSESAYDDGVIYVSNINWGGGGNFGGDFLSTTVGSDVYALSAADGAVRWQTNVTGASIGGLGLANGVLYMATADGTLHALNAATGDEIWTNKVGEWMASGVTISEGRLFVGEGFFMSGGGQRNQALHAFAL